MYSHSILLAIMNLQVDQSTLVAAGIGSAITFLFTLGKVKPIAKLIGYIALAFFSAHYLGEFATGVFSGVTKISPRPEVAPFSMAAFAWLWIPVGADFVERWAKKKAEGND